MGYYLNYTQGKDWVHKEFKRGLDPNYPDHESWNYPTWENLAKFPGGRNDPEILAIEQEVSEDEFAQEYAALFSAFSKGVFKEFTLDSHVRQHTYNPDWPNYQFWDFGFVGATVCLDVQVSPDDRIYVWREYYKSGITIENVIEELKHRNDPDGYKVINSFGDVASPACIETICEKWAPCEGDKAAKDDWQQGIFNVKRFLKQRSDGLPGFIVDPACQFTIEEFETYQSASENRYGVIQKEKAVKRNDHAMDAIRYGIMHLFFLGPQESISEVVEINKHLTIAASESHVVFSDGNYIIDRSPYVEEFDEDDYTLFGNIMEEVF